MRTREEIIEQIASVESSGYQRIDPLPLIVEALLDIRDLLQSLQSKNIIVATEENPDCNCAVTKTDGESEHWPQCRYA